MRESTGLYGICNSNRTVEDHWGKNCFNSSFPAAMANYMLDKGIPAIYITLGKNLQIVSKEIKINDIYRCGKKHPQDLMFSFESIYEPYQKYSFDRIDGIDLVVKDADGKSLAPLEVKLTVFPTSQTSRLSTEQWGSELVVRSATTSYCAFGMFDAVAKDKKKVREIFEKSCSAIQSWDNNFEMSHKTGALCEALNTFEKKYFALQKPLVMEPLWRTQGQSPVLDEQAFDLVVWSDYAFSRLFIDKAEQEPPTEMSRPMRATAKLARCLWELSKSGKIHVDEIYRQMAFGTQTDKEFAIQGPVWRKYVCADRINHFALSRNVLDEIIEEGYIERLRPERRFDQTLYFTMRQKD